jgi:hypothetical protein
MDINVCKYSLSRIRNAKVTSSIPVTGTRTTRNGSRAWRWPSPFSLGGAGASAQPVQAGAA